MTVPRKRALSASLLLENRAHTEMKIKSATGIADEPLARAAGPAIPEPTQQSAILDERRPRESLERSDNRD